MLKIKQNKVKYKEIYNKTWNLKIALDLFNYSGSKFVSWEQQSKNRTTNARRNRGLRA